MFSALTEILSLGLGWGGRGEMGGGRNNTHRDRSWPSQPFSGTNTHTISLYSLPHEVPVAGIGGLAIPQPHLLMQIVVKQDQIEVQLQAPQRPLLDSMLTATLLRTGRGKGEMGLLIGLPPRIVESQKALSLSPRQLCQAGSPSLCLSHLLWFMCNMKPVVTTLGMGGSSADAGSPGQFPALGQGQG